MSRPSTAAARVACAALCLAFALLAASWAMDRSHRWEKPRLERDWFRPLRDETRATGETWLMPVNPHCPSCVARARAFFAFRPRHSDAVRRVLLMVDQRRAPEPRTWAGLAADAVWWDRDGVWRRRWGHRVYGEVLRFDAQGRYRGTSPPLGFEPSISPPDREGGDSE